MERDNNNNATGVTQGTDLVTAAAPHVVMAMAAMDTAAVAECSL